MHETFSRSGKIWRHRSRPVTLPDVVILMVGAKSDSKSFYKYVKATLAQDAQDAVVYVSSLPDRDNVGCSSNCGVCSGNTVTTQSLNFRQPRNWESYVIAHELGHLLGMAHEGSCPPHHTPGNEGLRCRKQEFGYVLGSGKPPNYFSRCLQDQTRGCLMTRTKKCFELTGAKKIF
ncbi:uncharacterized protein ISCGN_022271 [Ixodes scapularis]